MDHLSRSLLNCYTLQGLDRKAELRSDTQWIADQLASPEVGFFPIWRGHTVVTETGGDSGKLTPLSTEAVAGEPTLQECGAPIFLGMHPDGPRFALPVSGAISDMPERLAKFGEMMDLRTAGRELHPGEATVFAHAKALSEWQDRHRFCPACGSPNKVADAGHVLKCSGDDCGRSQFPRMDPAIIVRVVFENKILLGRQAVWAPHQYSVVAGFVEPGESLEQAVVREVEEEAGVPVTEVHYQSSQPWPFPGNIMLGFAAVASDDQITLNDNELEHARWFTREEIVAGLNEKSLRVPPNISISFRLIEHWFNDGGGDSLLEVTQRAGYEWAPPPQSS